MFEKVEEINGKNIFYTKQKMSNMNYGDITKSMTNGYILIL